jgi:hypothetical protein
MRYRCITFARRQTGDGRWLGAGRHPAHSAFGLVPDAYAAHSPRRSRGLRGGARVDGRDEPGQDVLQTSHRRTKPSRAPQSPWSSGSSCPALCRASTPRGCRDARRACAADAEWMAGTSPSRTCLKRRTGPQSPWSIGSSCPALCRASTPRGCRDARRACAAGAARMAGTSPSRTCFKRRTVRIALPGRARPRRPKGAQTSDRPASPRRSFSF